MTELRGSPTQEPPDPTAGDTPNLLPITDTSIARTPIVTRHPANKKLSLLPLIFLIYFEVAGGPFGEEPAVKAAGPLLAILGFLVFPFIWSVPEVLITAELSIAFPGNGGFVIWAHRAFGPFFGSLVGTWKFLSGVINVAAFPVLCIDYLKKLFPVFASGLPRKLAILISTLFLSFVNYTGLTVVGYAALGLGLGHVAGICVVHLVEEEVSDNEATVPASHEPAGARDHVPPSACVPDIYHGQGGCFRSTMAMKKDNKERGYSWLSLCACMHGLELDVLGCI
ncbi:hypothetical protein RJ640_019235 [Escallonia rubra]|uniref:Polyamine transporter n=1 Tax=Escallonia rubra TaxID=112253 RepID=A0AA88RBD6_9ASTE|nr:hypothetical protein RJ640_019235 [Escallonia rubra]